MVQNHVKLKRSVTSIQGHDKPVFPLELHVLVDVSSALGRH